MVSILQKLRLDSQFIVMCAFLLPSVTIYLPPLVEVLLELRRDPELIVICAFLVPSVTIY
jgi:hypothetical protein